MLQFNQLVAADSVAMTTVTLSYDQRVKSRQKVALDNGESAGLLLPRGTQLCHGDKLGADNGEIIEVIAAKEPVSTIAVDDAVLLARACYHLGNRHVALQIEPGFVRYQHDHVLDAMIEGLGLSVTRELAAFSPEPGAYDTGGHGHAHHEH